MKKQYNIPEMTWVSIQFGSICKISSIDGGDLNIGGDVENSQTPIEPM